MITIYSSAKLTLFAVMMRTDMDTPVPKGAIIRGSVRRVSDGEVLLRFTCTAQVHMRETSFRAEPAWNAYSKKVPAASYSSPDGFCMYGLQHDVLTAVTRQIERSRVASTGNFWVEESSGKDVALGRNTDFMYMEIDAVESPDGNSTEEYSKLIGEIRKYYISQSRAMWKIRRVISNPLPPMFSDWNISRMLDVTLELRGAGFYGNISEDWTIGMNPVAGGMDYHATKTHARGSAAITGHMHRGATLDDLISDIESKYKNKVVMGMCIYKIHLFPSGRAIVPTSIESY